ncbi:MAG: hypothetical protein IPQ04_03305 [Saprospiraceae bacterium]|jgi:hypothetical protein|nr:hypothetical protein [Saprospiraceae bacterium]
MGKITGISLEYYTGELNIVELYRNFFSKCKIDFFVDEGEFSYLIDYDPFYYKLKIGENIFNFVLSLIANVESKPLTFSLILDETIFMSHTINAIKREEINISISAPKLLDNLNVPDFSFYAERILPFFDYKNIMCLKFSFC